MEEYKEFISKKYSKFDKLAIMIFALGAKCHIGVIFCDDSMWTTCESRNKEDCDILLLYHGNLFLNEEKEVDGGEVGEMEKDDTEWVPA